MCFSLSTMELILTVSFQEKELVYLIITGAAIMLLLAMLVVFLFNYSRHKILKEKNLNQLLQINHKEDLIKNNILTQEKERKRIAKDLHDEVGGKLNVVRLYVNQVKSAIENPEEIKEIIQNSKKLIDETIQTTRRISHNLLPPVLEELGLAEAIQEYIHDLREVSDIEFGFSYQNIIDKRLEVFEEIQLFRVIQELVSNAIKHAEPTKIFIQLKIKHSATVLKVIDNGKGFSLNDFTVYKGLGLKNTKSRIEMLGGQTTFKSNPEKGTEVLIVLERKKDSKNSEH